MNKSYFPADRAGRIDWYKNFATEFPRVGKDLGFSDTEITNAVNDSKYAVHILTTLGPDIDSDPGHAANAVLSGQSSGDYVDLPAGGGGPAPVRPGIDTRRQARAERIKAHTKFSADATLNGSRPMSSSRVTVSGAEFVCSVESTMWPVRAALMAMPPVSRSRISPTMMMFGSCRRNARSAAAKVMPISVRTST